MCGITGFFRTSNDGPEVTTRDLMRMNETLRHRGPDDEGWFIDGRVGLAHRRLSILDLSPRGHQPMTDREKRLWIVFNGEIYNFRELRKELGEFEFTSSSDTEVILCAYRKWGVGCLSRFTGMFAFALWDSDRQTLMLARDRLGKKPLYYYHHRGHFAFASELKALIEYPRFEKELDFQSLYEYLVFQYVPDPRTIYRHTFKLLPGHYMMVQEGTLEEKCYWSIVESEKLNADEGALRSELEALLLDSIRLRLVSDVPVGAFLSGGIDSSLIVALLQAHLETPVKTFTIGFRESSYDEAPFARRVAEYLGTEHQELYVTPEETYSVVPELPRHYDEPFSDSSAIPTYLVSRMARTQVKVCLSGDGGDELFCGYNRYAAMERVKFIRSIPLSREIASLMGGVPGFFWEMAGRAAKRLLFGDMKVKVTARRIREAAKAAQKDSIDFYLGLVRIWSEEEAERLLGRGKFSLDRTAFFELNKRLTQVGEPERFSLIDIATYLLGDILTKVDRASMAHSLEVRVPLLDHRVVEFSRALPYSYKCRGKESKYLIKKLLYSKVPADYFLRPKQGFGIPISSWLAGELKYLVDEYLEPQRLRREGILDEPLVTAMVRSHMDGTEDNGYRLYNLLMFQMWKELYL